MYELYKYANKGYHLCGTYKDAVELAKATHQLGKDGIAHILVVLK